MVPNCWANARFVTLVLIVESMILTVFAAANYEINARTHRDLIHLSRQDCLPLPGERTSATWNHGRLQCERYQDMGFGMVPKRLM